MQVNNYMQKSGKIIYKSFTNKLRREMASFELFMKFDIDILLIFLKRSSED